MRSVRKNAVQSILVLARRLSRMTGLPIAEDCLIRIAQTERHRAVWMHVLGAKVWRTLLRW